MMERYYKYIKILFLIFIFVTICFFICFQPVISVDNNYKILYDKLNKSNGEYITICKNGSYEIVTINSIYVCDSTIKYLNKGTYNISIR